ncbi:sugar porter (SP) family MFS transporter [Povalibacter uvarum]|uniref:Sugar porter (SP) family MFS transporter n=1 Tax=Povalibacter uvarum TaxID=732238 RepID=A0A841HJF9_9GAMM|nr:sugar porter family MFS transporter [Povalibacter uvarum]MBB6092440.1 sugar porter (SP) family MFS transporter [Povalibacter uvarum]
MNRGLFLASISSAALAGLLFGFDTAVISGVTADLRNVYSLSPAALGATVSSALIGTLIGALCAGVVGDRYGSRDALRWMAVLYLVSGLGCAVAWNWPALLIFRFIGGLAIGGSSVLAPVYIAEIAPPQRRGMLVGLFQINIVAGILIAYLSNFLVGQVMPDEAEWRWKFAVTIVPAMLLLGMLLYIPHSPRWLIAKGRAAEALEALRRIGMPDARGTLEEIRQSTHATSSNRLSWHQHRKPILLAVAIAMFNQLAGINAILYYLNDIFAAAGFGRVSSDLQAVAIGATNLVFTLIAMLFIDRVGRRRLLLVGAVGMFICLTFVAGIMGMDRGHEWLIVTLIGFIAFFAFSQGAVIWVYISEIFPTPVRARGQSIGSSTHWIMNALITFLFPLVAAQSKAAPFAFFAAMMVLQFLVVLRYFPETKGAKLEDMEALMNR